MIEDRIINIMEVAADLARRQVEFTFGYSSPSTIWDDPQSGIQVYTKEAQEVFDEYYTIEYKWLESISHPIK